MDRSSRSPGSPSRGSGLPPRTGSCSCCSRTSTARSTSSSRRRSTSGTGQSCAPSRSSSSVGASSASSGTATSSSASSRASPSWHGASRRRRRSWPRFRAPTTSGTDDRSMLARMAGVPYDAEHIARFFDQYGAREWDRFDASPMDRVNLEVHLRFLREHIPRDARVLDAGAGPGRFTLELARLGATVVAGDISPGQLALHAEKTACVEESIESRQLLDIRELGRFDDQSFDAVVCFGGPLSYVLGEAETALEELIRVTRSSG